VAELRAEHDAEHEHEHNYDAGRSALKRMRSVPGRAEVGPRSAGRRTPETAALAAAEAALTPVRRETAENAKGRENPDRLPVVAGTPVVARPAHDPASSASPDRFESASGRQTETTTTALVKGMP